MGGRSPVFWALILTLFIGGIIAGLNLFGERGTFISEVQFDHLLKQGLIGRIEITSHRIRGYLKGSVGERGGEQVLLLRTGRPISEGEIASWKGAGIEVAVIEVKEEQGQGGWFALLGLLGVGLWYLWMQARRDRREGGSPRRRLEALECRYREGKISLEEYRQGVEDLSAEL